MDDNIRALIAYNFDSMIMDQSNKCKQAKKSKLPEIFDFVLFCIKTYSNQTIYLFLKAFIDSKSTFSSEDAQRFSKSCNDHYRITNNNFHTDEFFEKLYFQRLSYQGNNVSDFKKQFFNSTNDHFQRYKKLQPNMLEYCCNMIFHFESNKPVLQKQSTADQKANIEQNAPVTTNYPNDGAIYDLPPVSYTHLTLPTTERV